MPTEIMNVPHLTACSGLLLLWIACSISSSQAQDSSAIKPKPAESSFAVRSGANSLAVFSTYMSITELADLYGARAYSKPKALQLAAMYQKLTESAKESLTGLIETGTLEKGEEATARQMLEIDDLLGETLKSMIAYINAATDGNLHAYEVNRKKAWDAVSKFLGPIDN